MVRHERPADEGQKLVRDFNKLRGTPYAGMKGFVFPFAQWASDNAVPVDEFCGGDPVVNRQMFPALFPEVIDAAARAFLAGSIPSSASLSSTQVVVPTILHVTGHSFIYHRSYVAIRVRCSTHKVSYTVGHCCILCVSPFLLACDKLTTAVTIVAHSHAPCLPSS